MKVTEYKYKNVTVRIHEPIRTPEEQKAWEENLKKACEKFVRNVGIEKFCPRSK